MTSGQLPTRSNTLLSLLGLLQYSYRLSEPSQMFSKCIPCTYIMYAMHIWNTHENLLTPLPSYGKNWKRRNLHYEHALFPSLRFHFTTNSGVLCHLHFGKHTHDVSVFDRCLCGQPDTDSIFSNSLLFLSESDRSKEIHLSSINRPFS